MQMNTILISDIKTNKKSVIPYALNFIKYIDDKIKIIHLVDPRKRQAVSSAYADSQTFEIGKKLSHAEILEREKHQIKLGLDKVLSKEASKLNFPLRVNTIVEEKSIENCLSTEINLDKKRLILSSSEFNGTNIDDIDEFLELKRKFEYLGLIIPAGMEFKFPSKVIVYHDFKKGNKVDLNELIDFYKYFNPELQIVDFANNKSINDITDEVEAWKKVKLENFNSNMMINIDIVESENTEQGLMDFIESNNADIISLPQQTQYGFSIYKSNIAKNLIKKITKPVIIY